jgi:hypothetical protein
LSTQFQVVQIFKTIMKQNLRSLLRKEQSNRDKKIHVILRIVGLYLNIEKEFYPICAYEVVQEFGSRLSGQPETLSEAQLKTYNSLLYLVNEIDWQRKRIEPNIKEVVRKLPMLA